ncbi:MAG: hypothetical protein JJT89_06240 [Nitriliruptoraceae bacterium]|nr:hypothetical protein [Nitriliruptoraceae bacterium]
MSRARRTAREALVLGLLASMLAGCAGWGSLLVDSDVEVATESEEPDATTVEEADDGAVDRADDADVADEVDEPTADAVEVAPAIDLDLPGIELLTPASGEGPRPELRWAEVDGASSYLVVLRRDADGAASWAWRGTGTSVPVGPVEQPGLGAPEVEAGMSWSVLAFDAADEPVAQSRERSIAP